MILIVALTGGVVLFSLIGLVLVAGDYEHERIRWMPLMGRARPFIQLFFAVVLGLALGWALVLWFASVWANAHVE